LTESERLNEKGRTLRDRGEVAAAIEAYRSSIAADGSWSVPWYNLGLLYKYEGAWAESLQCNQEAVNRNAGDGDAWWNLGIAATAVGDWSRARAAWKECGVQIPPGAGPITVSFGLVPIRLSPETRGEVVWCDRICPARAIVRNVPLPESDHFYGDVVLHDGAPEGSRMLHGQEVPVFNSLARLERSPFRTYILDLPESTRAQRASLTDVAFDRGTWAEDWSESVTFLCRSCSYGLPHAEHDAALASSRPGLAVAVAARDPDEVDDLLARWREAVGYDGYAGVTLAGDDI
jgi:tetratricopeptide (TPR) repeat protein